MCYSDTTTVSRWTGQIIACLVLAVPWRRLCNAKVAYKHYLYLIGTKGIQGSTQLESPYSSVRPLHLQFRAALRTWNNCQLFVFQNWWLKVVGGGSYDGAGWCSRLWVLGAPWTVTHVFPRLFLRVTDDSLRQQTGRLPYTHPVQVRDPGKRVRILVRVIYLGAGGQCSPDAAAGRGSAIDYTMPRSPNKLLQHNIVPKQHSYHCRCRSGSSRGVTKIKRTTRKELGYIRRNQT